MTIRHTTFHSAIMDTKIHRVSALPNKPQGRGTVLVLHGLGDHIGCHEKAMELFCQNGYEAEGFDWPGNGRSSGKRGDIPGVRNAVKLLLEIINSLDQPPVAIYAHSTGAFITLAFLNRYHNRFPLKWLWLSAPLLVPTHGLSRLRLKAAKLLAHFAPKLTIPTGVQPSHCYHINSLNPALIARQLRHCHAKISARFAKDLIIWEPRVALAATQINSPTSVLVTQGDEDTICPPKYALEMFKSISTEKKTYLSLKGLRHEPLREPNNQEFLDSVADWLAANSIAN